jgi:molecular chaperone GrpE
MDMSDEQQPTTSREQNDSAESLEERLQAVIAERDDYMDKWTRARADLENYRKRIQKELEEDRKYAALPLLRGILAPLDNLDRAIQAAKRSHNVDELIAGIELVVKQFDSALTNVGATPIQAVGQPFDPNKHEAIQQVPSADHPPMTVVQDAERGYMLHDRVVRPSKVIVSSAPQ